MIGFLFISAIVVIAIFFIYPFSELESIGLRLFKAIWMGSLIGLAILGLSKCGLGGGETEINYRR